MPVSSRLVLVAALVVCSTRLRAAPRADPDSCSGAIAASERAERLPAQVLGAIGIVESGRVDPRTGTLTPWPWTINVAGAGHVFDTAADAIAAVRAAQAAGIESIDVGCMQVNLLHHPQAFPTLEDAFDPAANVRYAAGFLARLHARAGTWPDAVALYHSSTPAIGVPYAQRVAMLWPQAMRYGMVPPAEATAPDPVAALSQAADPAGVLTPEFRAQLVAAAQFRQQRDAALGLVPAVRAVPPTGKVAAATGPAWARSPQATVVAGHDGGPAGLVTPEFRTISLADAAFRRRRDVALGLVRPGPAPTAR